MPFEAEIGLFQAPTQEWEDAKFDERYPEDRKSVEALIVISVSRESITWFIKGDLDVTSQAWRDVLYGTAAKAHRASNGCVGYYRGTDSLHIKRQHIIVEEAIYNHNHYRFEKEVTPALFAVHMRNFLYFDYNAGRFLHPRICEDLIQAYASCYAAEDRNAYNNSSYYQYTPMDQAELAEGLALEGACHDASKSLTHSMVGIRTDIAEERLHHVTSPLVIQKRLLAKLRKVERTVRVKEWLASLQDESKTDVVSAERDQDIPVHQGNPAPVYNDPNLLFSRPESHSLQQETSDIVVNSARSLSVSVGTTT